MSISLTHQTGEP